MVATICEDAQDGQRERQTVMDRRAAFFRRMPVLGAFAVLPFLFPAGVQAGPRLFGTVEFQMELKKPAGWLEAMKRNSKSPIFFDEKRFNASTLWKDIRLQAENKPFLEQLEIVNKFWNQWPYRTDKEVYGKADYWAAPYEFLAKSGDCEDYCIVKYYTLKALGVPAERMRIVVVRETIRNLGHAVLAVYGKGDEIYILDNLSEAVRPAQRVRNYAPQFSVNETHRWVHIKPR